MILFDQYSRYKAAADLIRVNLNSPGSRIVDIGCGADCLLATFLAEEAITFVDPLLVCRMPSDSKTTEFPRLGCTAFAEGYIEHCNSDASYDCVVAIDTLEHIPAAERPAFLQTLVTLSTDTIILGFPSSDTPDALNVDNAVDDCFKAHFGHSYPWLQEHRDYGLPSHEATSNFFKNQGWTTTVLNHGNTEWLTALLPRIVCLWEELSLRELAFAISEPFNKEFASLDLGGPTGYRKYVIAKKNCSPILPDDIDLNRSNSNVAWQRFLKQIDFLILRGLLDTSRKSATLTRQIEMPSDPLDNEIMRLNSVVEDSSESLKTFMSDLRIRDEEVLRLNSVVTTDSATIKKMINEVLTRDQEIDRLQKVAAQASKDITTLSKKLARQ